MAAILGLFTAPPDAPEHGDVRRMLSAMADRGAERVRGWREGPHALAASRDAWEEELSDGEQVYVTDDVVVAADASLFYLDDLRAAIAAAGVPIVDRGAAALIASAYRAWGVDCSTSLEGDFAFVLLDRRLRRVLCARDFVGRRPLYFAERRGTLVAASTAMAVATRIGSTSDLDTGVLAHTAAGFLGATGDAPFRGVRPLPAGHILLREGRSETVVRRAWVPPVFESGPAMPFDQAAATLRDLLTRAVEERMPRDQVTSVWMSGGWDSTAVFGAGQSALTQRSLGRQLRPVSISYPVGDDGREDELIDSVCARWGATPHWISIGDIPLLDDPVRRSAVRDEPVAHVYEAWNRALAIGSRATGARVALDGIGGDGLFAVSPVFHADLMVRGQWLKLAREWQSGSMAGTGFRHFFRWAIQPALPGPMLQLATVLRRGRRLKHYMERPIPRWLRAGVIRPECPIGYVKPGLPRRKGQSFAAYETQWHLTTPWIPLLLSGLSTMGLAEGVEIRSPLMDERVVRFAATRPREDRMQARETKKLLRASMRGLLPDEVLAPRPRRTGTTGTYFRQRMSTELPALLDREFGSLALADLGVVDADALRKAIAEYACTGEANLGVNLFFTVQTELWARARLSARGSALSVTVARAEEPLGVGS